MSGKVFYLRNSKDTKATGKRSTQDDEEEVYEAKASSALLRTSRAHDALPLADGRGTSEQRYRQPKF